MTPQASLRLLAAVGLVALLTPACTETEPEEGPDVASPDAEVFEDAPNPPEDTEDTVDVAHDGASDADPGDDASACGPCDTPPPPTCLDVETLQTFASSGSCVSGACAYAPSERACSHGCEAGRCLGDPCADVTCESPPSQCHAEIGSCRDGVCSYEPLDGTTCDDDDPCTTGDRCEAGSCRGTQRSCQSPPPAACADDDTLRVFSPAGVCGGNGECGYDEALVPCQSGCAEGACLSDPCEGVSCTSPPSACHDPEGTCQSGVCVYDFDNGAPCDDEDPCTVNDRCTAGVCGGTQRTCNTPEEGPSCVDGTTLRVPVTHGSCEAGACVYATEDIPCAFGCDAGACAGDPCAGVSCHAPPEAICVNATTRRAPTVAAGTCSGGDCNYQLRDTTCLHGCQGGVCLPPAGLVISEVLYDSTGWPDTDSFLEIHGPPGTNLQGVSVVGVNGNGGADYVTIPLEGQIGADGLFIIAHPEALPFIADVADMTTPDIDLQNGPDNVQLRFGGVILDALAYGTFGSNHVFAGEGRPHPAARVNHSLFRDPGFTDTDDNLDDFDSGPPSPGLPTPPLHAALEGPTGPLLVGESFTVDAAASTGPIVTYTFDFGDGTAPVSGPEATADHSYSAAGTFVVTVTVETGGGASQEASLSVEAIDPEPADPFEPLPGDANPLTSDGALALLDGQSAVLLSEGVIQTRTRTCSQGSCGPWSEPVDHVGRYLTYSGGSVTRYINLLSETRLFLYLASGQPRLSIRHVTHVAQYPTRHADGITFGFPPEPISGPTMHVYNFNPTSQWDYRDTYNFIGRNGRLELGQGRVRFVSSMPLNATPENMTEEFAIIYTFQP